MHGALVFHVHVGCLSSVGGGSGVFRVPVFHFRLGCLASVGGGLVVWSGPIAVAHAPVQLSCSVVLITHFLGAPCCLLLLLDNLLLGFPFWFLSVRWRWNGRVGPLPVSEELVLVSSCVSNASWLVRSFRGIKFGWGPC